MKNLSAFAWKPARKGKEKGWGGRENNTPPIVKCEQLAFLAQRLGVVFNIRLAPHFFRTDCSPVLQCTHMLTDAESNSIFFILTRVARERCICASAPTLVGPQRFISGSICPSNPFERELNFASPSERAAESQNLWRLSNTDAPVCLHRWAVSPALRSRSSEKEKKLSNRPAASSCF